MLRSSLLWLLVAVVLGLVGCASGPAVTAMVPEISLRPPSAPSGTMVVGEVTGGEETNPMWVSSIDNQSFHDALVAALMQSRLFTKVLPAGSDGDYRLNAEIVSQEVKSGINMSATLMTHYELFQPGKAKAVWADNVFSQHEAQFAESYYGVERAKKANEGAVRDNLKKLVEKLAAFLEKAP